MANILLADDDKSFGSVLKRELEEERHIVDLVPDGVNAVLSFRAKSYDFVLLDLKMPRLGGLEALKIIKKINPNVPVITFSGGAGAIEKAESVTWGAINCLTKPFKLEQLKNEIGKKVSILECQE